MKNRKPQIIMAGFGIIASFGIIYLGNVLFGSICLCLNAIGFGGNLAMQVFGFNPNS